MHRSLHDGRSDGLEPLESLSLGNVTSFADLLRAMSKTAFSGRELGRAFDVLLDMARNPECHVVLTLSGAMTVAKQGRIICDLIDRGIVQTVVATGALIAHGLTESIGLTHYRYDSSKSDEELFDQGYNRIYDTLEMESNLNDVERLVRSVLNDDAPPGGVWSSSLLCRALGKRLSERNEGPGILRSAFDRDVPVFIPAFTDSEIGLDVSTWAMSQALAKVDASQRESMSANEVFDAVPSFNPFLDLQSYARRIGASRSKGGESKTESEAVGGVESEQATTSLGIFTIGGGVPRNWAQQVAPYYDITNGRVGVKLDAPRFRYGVRICPEPVHWGGLSGCTYSEGVSWGKFVPPAEGGRFAEVHADATVALPLLARAVFEEFDRGSQNS
ncbi:MAG: deoxyhypusine synthase family protein [Planctomycetota bacterium]|nr:deoxyhypusine synthase family protein [Planctomycetota bacterium]